MFLCAWSSALELRPALATTSLSPATTHTMAVEPAKESINTRKINFPVVVCAGAAGAWETTGVFRAVREEFGIHVDECILERVPKPIKSEVAGAPRLTELRIYRVTSLHRVQWRVKKTSEKRLYVV